MTTPTDFYRHELDVADNFATKAISRLRVDEIPPVPQNFEVWYVYYANVNPKLRDEINEILLDREKVTEQDCNDLYEKYLNFGNDRETYQKAGDQINIARCIRTLAKRKTHDRRIYRHTKKCD